MAYLFLDDGGPDADEYANNYLYFDGNNSQTVEKIVDILSYGDTRDPEVRKRLEDVCLSRSDDKPKRNGNRVELGQIDEVPKKRKSFFRQTQRLNNLFLRCNELVNGKSGYQQSISGSAMET